MYGENVKSNMSGKNTKSARSATTTGDRWNSAHRDLGAIDPAVSGRQPSCNSGIAHVANLGCPLAQILAFAANRFESTRF